MKSWWQLPRLRLDGSEEERATCLEMFYDLVFVVAIAKLTHHLNQDVSLSGFFSFVVLFIPIWWAWIGTVFYTIQFGSNDLAYRLLTVLQMVAIAALAVNIEHGLDKNSAEFALAYRQYY